MKQCLSQEKHKFTQPNAQNQSQVLTSPQQLARLVNIIFLLGEIIIVFTNRKHVQLIAAEIKLFGGILAIIAAILAGQEAAREENLPCDVIPPLEKQVIIGASISEIGALILTDALRQEIAQEVAAKPPTISPFIAGLGAVGQ